MTATEAAAGLFGRVASSSVELGACSTSIDVVAGTADAITEPAASSNSMRYGLPVVGGGERPLAGQRRRR